MGEHGVRNDVAKAKLEVFIRTILKSLSVRKEEVGFRELLRQLTSADFVILDATGALALAGARAIYYDIAGSTLIRHEPGQLVQWGLDFKGDRAVEADFIQ